MDVDVKPLRVELGNRSYHVYVGQGLIRRTGELIKENLHSAGRCAVITNEEIHRLHGSPLMASLEKAGFDAELILVPDGEEAKSWDVAGSLLGELVDLGLDRKSVVIAFGGGAVGDVAGFVASIYLRGVRLVQVPTTLLSLVDSSIGGKAAVNHPKGKNLIGAFHQPSVVVADPRLLGTLPQRELISGLGEVVKYGVIADSEIFNILEKKSANVLRKEMDVLVDVISRCCTIKARLVELDERDTAGLRAALNYGHTVGHALEVLTHLMMGHGEAVAVGMNVAAQISSSLGLIGEADVERQRRLLRRLGLETELPNVVSSKLLEAMHRDKKVERDTVRFVLPTGIGSSPILKAVHDNLIRQVLEEGDV